MSLSSAILRSSSRSSRLLCCRYQPPLPRAFLTTAQHHQHQQQYAFFATATGTPGGMPPKSPEKDKDSKPVVLRMDDLVKTVAETHKLSQAESRRIIDTIVDTISDALSENKKVALSSFGSFSTYTAKQRHYRNPRTGADVMSPAKERIRFKAYTSLKKIVEQQK